MRPQKPGWPTLKDTPTSAAGAETAKRIIMTVNRECIMLGSSSLVSSVAPLYATGNRSSYHGCFFTSSWNPGNVGVAASYNL
jgi:hypothetical protein